MTDQNCKQSGLPGAALLFGISIIISAFLITKSVDRFKQSSQTLTVKGYAEKKIVSDFASWRSSFAVTTKDLVAGYRRLEEDLTKVQVYLNQAGIPGDAMTVKSVNTITYYRYDKDGRNTGDVNGYQLTRSIEVNSSDVKLIQRLANESTALLEKGIGFASHQPQYFFQGIEDIKLDMLADATANARDRAKRMAEASDQSIGRLKSARQGVFQITAPFSTDVSDYGMYDTSSIDKVVKAVVTAGFEIR